MNFEQASNKLGNEVCERLELDPDCRSVSVVKSPILTVWDLDSEIERQWCWLPTKQPDYRLAVEFDLLPRMTKTKLVPDRAKAIIKEEFLEPRQFASYDDKETIASELAYRKAIGKAQGSSRGVRQVPLKHR